LPWNLISVLQGKCRDFGYELGLEIRRHPKEKDSKKTQNTIPVGKAQKSHENQE
jgi:hypothetical protein